MVKTQYIQNPCKASALPFYKENRYKQNPNVDIVHESNIGAYDLEEYTKYDRFFKLIHKLSNKYQSSNPNYEVVQYRRGIDDQIMVDIINASYPNTNFDIITLNQIVMENVFEETLCIFIVDKNSNTKIASSICQFDTIVGEVIFDWIQVLPGYRGQGIGTLLVNELLERIPINAKFATVSGDCDNSFSPEKLYRKCGFEGTDIWYILYKNRKK